MNLDRFRHRAWIMEKQEMRELADGFSLSKTYVSPDMKPVLEIYPDCERYIIGEECFLMQCTGLKDSEGNLVWEGDVVAIGKSGKRSLVNWIQDYARFDLVDDHDGLIDYELGVVGNVFEHPELLEVDKK